MRRLVLLLVTILSVTAATASYDEPDRPPDRLNDVMAASVLIDAGKNGQGSGVCFKNGRHTFVWTNAHVVADLAKVSTGIDPKTGQPRVYIWFKDLNCVQPLFENGRQVGQVSRTAKVIRCNNDEDLAVLKLYGQNWPEKSAHFPGPGFIPKGGTPLWHVGSPSGEANMNTPLPGVFLLAGRVRYGTFFDHVALPALHGCSGGGVYQKHDGLCIGVISEFAASYKGNLSHGHFIIVPVRRMHEYARRVHVTYAMTTGVPVPEVDDEPICDEPLAVPAPAAPKGDKK